jgi:mono/diheme cytochrome c family protein
MNRLHYAALVFFSLLVWAFTAVGQQSPHAATNAKTRTVVTTSNNEGEKRFRTNCGRCHNPPEGLSPREVRAVIRHMRVRAMLSAEDEKQIRAYLAP